MMDKLKPLRLVCRHLGMLKAMGPDRIADRIAKLPPEVADRLGQLLRDAVAVREFDVSDRFFRCQLPARPATPRSSISRAFCPSTFAWRATVARTASKFIRSLTLSRIAGQNTRTAAASSSRPLSYSQAASASQ
jgi:hypothetical protein